MTKTKLENFLDNFITYSFATLLFFVPLLLWPKTSEVFEFNKMMFTYLSTGLITSSFLIQSLLQGDLKIKRTFLDIPLLLFFLGQLLATIFSIDLHTSLWGYYSRFHGGLISTISYLLLYFTFTSHFSQEKNQKHLKTTILNSILASAGLVAFYGFLEHFGIDKHVWIQDVQNRVFSTLGQPNWLSAYLVTLLPVPIFLAYYTQSTKKRLLYFSLASLYYITILFTKSRSGIGTTFIILTLSFLFLLLRSTKVKRKLKPLILTTLSCLLITFLIGTPWSPNPAQISHRIDVGGPIWPTAEPLLNKINLTTQTKPLQTEKLDPQTQQLVKAKQAGIRFGGSDSFDIRRVVWTGAFRLFKQNPALGTGVETFAYSYYWTRPVQHNQLSEWDFLYNKAHNEYLNFLATTGLVGTLTYLSLIVFTLFILIKTSLKNQDKPLPTALLLGYISILITNFFGFSVVPVALFFYLYPALLLSLYPQFNKHLSFSPKFVKKDSLLKQLLITVIMLLTLFWSITIIRHWLADLKYNKGRSFSSAGYIASAIPLLEDSTDLYSNEPTFRSELSKSYSQAALSIHQQLASLPASQAAQLEASAQNQINQYTTQAVDNINITLDQNPHHLNFYKAKAQVFITLAQINPDYYQQAIQTLIRAHQKAPTDPKLVYNLGLLYQNTQKTQEALTSYQKALELKPDYTPARTAYIKLLDLLNQDQKAKQQLDILLESFPNHQLKDQIQ